ncbi:MAG: hypothetical protein J6S21_00090 [Victivallales bacterium]|nr:hypothetical protein [Victivallales bacterium]
MQTSLKLISALMLLGASLFAQVKMTENVEVKDFQLFNIFPCALGNEKMTAQDMMEYREKTGQDIALYSLSLHPEGRPASRKAELYAESYRKVKAELAGSDVRLGVLIQSILGHWPRVDKNEEKWTRSINIKGEAVRYCPLDKDFRNYIFNTIAMLAKEKPVFFMGDDDIRGYSHDAECFCHLHVARFNQMTGRSFTSKSMREAVSKCKVDDEIYKAFRKMQQEMVDGVAALIREAIDSVDPSIPAATCMPGEEMRFNSTAAQAIAAKGQPPVMRICNGQYGEGSPKIFCHVVLHSHALREAHPGVTFALEEADTFPHTLYSKSAVSMNSKMCLSILSDFCGAKVWLVSAHKAGNKVNQNYADIIAEYNEHHQELVRSVRGTRKSGVAIPLNSRFIKWHPLTPNATDEFFYDQGNWGDNVFGNFGIPYYGTFRLDDDTVYALSGANTIRRFSDEEITTLLKGKVIIDGPAAAELTRRGFANLMGVTAEYTAPLFRFEYDERSGKSYPISRQKEFPELKLTDGKAQVMSSLYYAAFANSPDKEKVAPATIVYKNSLGGTVGVTNLSIADMYWYNLLTDARKNWALNFLDLVNGGQLPNVVPDYQNALVLTRKAGDGSQLVAIFNQNFDPMQNVKIRADRKPAKIMKLTPDGKWEKVSFKHKDGNVVIKHRLECYNFIVLKIH